MNSVKRRVRLTERDYELLTAGSEIFETCGRTVLIVRWAHETLTVVSNWHHGCSKKNRGC